MLEIESGFSQGRSMISSGLSFIFKSQTEIKVDKEPLDICLSPGLLIPKS